MKHLEGLNEKQKEAVLHTDGPILVVAGAGAGKTKTITHRILNLIKSGVEPNKILAVTFTNKAANEMKERISKMLLDLNYLENDQSPFISTFHSLCVYIIKENAKLLNLNKNFTILDESESISLIKESIKEADLNIKEHDPKRIKSIISKEKGNFNFVDNYLEKNTDYYASIVARVWQIYENKKDKEHGLDFDDLLVKATKLLKENDEIRKKYQETWQYIHIDEYQDTNEVQYILSKLLTEKYKNICAVGDMDQCIYSWRGANLKNILNFEKDFKEAKIILLEENYRSTQNILEAANEVIKKNIFRPEKNLFTKNKIGDKISLYEAIDEKDEAEYVAIKILELLDNVSKEEINNKKFLSEIAILYRANFQSRILEEYMINYNIPYQVLGIKFFERKEVKDVLSYLKASLNQDSFTDIKRIINFPKRGIGKTTLLKIFNGEINSLPIKMQIKINEFYKLLDEIKEKIKKEKTVDVIKYIIKRTNLENELLEDKENGEERLQNIKELVSLSIKYNELKEGKGVEKLLEDASLYSDQDNLILNKEKKQNENKIKLMTVHASKGLEFKYVFIVGLEDGLFPSSKINDSFISQKENEEERRLFYVALTRAKEKVFLSFANYRTIFGSKEINSPSEFIFDIPEYLIEKNKEKNIIYI